ncbi:hypothetical protein AB6N23_04615 [Cellulomonas sp. 179-A 9B4 NHS]|uniref:hypothetical protein n=1 Tax=Cellulomonas sp. 179-A 9B4 NHS TaxID=3142379 RepID=UPI0039A14BCB
MSSVPTDPTSDVPWGRPPVPDVPVPPFATRDEHVRFLRCLGVHVAASGVVPLQRPDVVLLTLLQEEADALRWQQGDHPVQPSALAMRIAVRTFFPAPWTPRALAESLRATGVLGAQHVEADERRARWGSDPTFAAERRDDGSWHVTRSERGSTRVYAELAGDDDLVLMLQEHYVVFGFPLGHRTDDVPVDALVTAATWGVESWTRHTALPYVATWSATVAAARAAVGDRPAPRDQGPRHT